LTRAPPGYPPGMKLKQTHLPPLPTPDIPGPDPLPRPDPEPPEPPPFPDPVI